MIDVLELEKVVQLRVSDPDMAVFDKLEKLLNAAEDVQFVKRSMTFETPIVQYVHQEIEFSLLFDEWESETFLAVVKPFDYRPVHSLLQKLV